MCPEVKESDATQPDLLNFQQIFRNPLKQPLTGDRLLFPYRWTMEAIRHCLGMLRETGEARTEKEAPWGTQLVNKSSPESLAISIVSKAKEHGSFHTYLIVAL